MQVDDHVPGVNAAVELNRFLMTRFPDSIAPVLGCVDSEEELMSAISPIKRRRKVVFPSRGEPRRINLRKSISIELCVLMICW